MGPTSLAQRAAGDDGQTGAGGCNLLIMVQVDSFVYENCSHGIDTFSEFCTGERKKMKAIT